MKNIFLTGPIKSGKSTILEQAIDDYDGSIGGFKTVPQFTEDGKRAYVLGSISPLIQAEEKPFICRLGKDGHMYAVTETFEDLGVRILQDCLKSKPDLIIMDELGILEAEAKTFQDYVRKCLASDIPVLGVIKAKPSLFLDELRHRSDVLVLPVCPENRTEIAENFKKLVAELLQKDE
ncbi:MAG TPA: hypothetical protein GX404_07720 [Syntrophomonadaceae bacterium]|nr:hypothetical protein [Syntrophomonadaceae bacterium]